MTVDSSNFHSTMLECAMLFANRHGIENSAKMFPEIIKIARWKV